jgi:hypothetical protein
LLLKFLLEVLLPLFIELLLQIELELILLLRLMVARHLTLQLLGEERIVIHRAQESRTITRHGGRQR